MTKQGFGMVEAIVSIAIAASLILVLVGVNLTYLYLGAGQGNKVQAVFLVEEGLEAVRFLRDSGWSSNISPFAVGTNHYLVFSNNKWQISASPSNIGIFTRTVVFGNVSRASDGSIVTSGGTLDPKTRLVTVTVSWQEKGISYNKTMSTYLTNLFSN